jgi:hypothetical protein
MNIGQNLRLMGNKVKNTFRFGKKGDDFATTDAPAAAAVNVEKKKTNWKAMGAVSLVALIPIYYIVGSLLTHRINDDLNFAIKKPPAGKSVTVEVIAALIDREVNRTKWSPNIQAFEPAALLRFGGNMVNFQTGEIRSLANVVFEMENRLARVRGTSAADPDIAAARQGLSRSADTWLWAGADSEYRKAASALQNYNTRLANGQAIFEVRADNLYGVLDKIANDLGGQTDVIDHQIVTGRKYFIDRKADKIFYYAKGQAYAYFIILRALREDYRAVLQEKRVERLYDEMLTDLAMAADFKPLIVQNANPDGAILPNHLEAEGFYILRSRAKLREITDILLK